MAFSFVVHPVETGEQLRRALGYQLIRNASDLRDTVDHCMRVLGNTVHDPGLDNWLLSVDHVLRDAHLLLPPLTLDESAFLASARRPSPTEYTVVSDDAPACMVCMDDDSKDSDSLVSLTMCCGASIHYNCVLKHYYAATNELFKSSVACPFCRHPLTFASLQSLC
jgi:hypothetical protein